MTSDEKILHVLSLIETANKITAKDGVIRLDCGSLDSNKVSEVELRSILEKLSSESIVELLRINMTNLQKILSVSSKI